MNARRHEIIPLLFSVCVSLSHTLSLTPIHMQSTRKQYTVHSPHTKITCTRTQQAQTGTPLLHSYYTTTSSALHRSCGSTSIAREARVFDHHFEGRELGGRGPAVVSVVQGDQSPHSNIYPREGLDGGVGCATATAAAAATATATAITAVPVANDPS